MKNLPSLSAFFFSLLMFGACQNNSSNAVEEDKPVKIEFDRSDIYISKKCASLTMAEIFVSCKVPTDKKLDFEVKFEEENLVEWSLIPKHQVKQIGHLAQSFHNNGKFEIKIPAFAKYGKNQVNCVVQCITEGFQEYSKSITVHYLDFEEEFEFIELKRGLTDLLEQRYWDNYEGGSIPENRSYILKHSLKDRIYKHKEQFVQKMNYQLTLVDEESKEAIKIKPDLFLEHTFSEKLNLQTRNNISNANTKSELFVKGTQVIAKYRTNSNPNLVPGYQIYGIHKGDFIKAKFVDCDSMAVLEKEKLTVPNRIVFKCFPKMK